MVKILLVLVILLTIIFYPKAYFIYKTKDGLVMDCQCYGMVKEDSKRPWRVNPDTKKLCYGVPIECDTRKITWIDYVKSDWSLVSVIVIELILMTAYTVFDKKAHKEDLAN